MSDAYTQYELDSSIKRLVELELAPVKGKFGLSHLKEIHRRIFQDFNHNILPGEFRRPPPQGKEWVKNRSIKVTSEPWRVVYSRMDDVAQSRLKQILDSIKPTELSLLGQTDFLHQIANLYTELDYIHPFQDGNSRTLRTFTRQIAADAGYELNWGKLELRQDGADLLCIARDKGVNQLALSTLQDNENILLVQNMLTRLEACPDLVQVMSEYQLLSRF